MEGYEICYPLEQALQWTGRGEPDCRRTIKEVPERELGTREEKSEGGRELGHGRREGGERA